MVSIFKKDPVVEQLASKTGWTYKEAKEMLAFVENNDIPVEEYLQFKLYRVDKEKLNFAYKREKRIQIIMKDTGWDHKTCDRALRRANRIYGINNAAYVIHKLYKYPEEDMKYEWECSKRRMENNKYVMQRKNDAIKGVMIETGWDEETAIKNMEEVKQELQFSYFDYCWFKLHFKDKQQQKELVDAIHEKRANRKIAKQENVENNIIPVLLEATGWDRDTLVSHYEKSKKLTGCTWSEYKTYKFYDLTLEEQDKILLLSHTDKIRRKYCRNILIESLIINKDEANKLFSKYTRRPYCMSNEVTLEEFKNIFKGCNKLFYKPNDSSMGRGAQPFDLQQQSIEEVYEELKTRDGIVEKYVVQHPKMNKMSPTAVNTIRFGTLSSEEALDEKGNSSIIVYATLKTGGRTGCVDNLHGGGVGASVDLETGKLCTLAIDDAMNTYEHHPVTGTTILGFEIPYFEEAKAMVLEIIKEFNMTGYFGWDVAIAEDGPMLIEVNGRPSPTLLVNPYYAVDKSGLKEVFEKYYDKL